MRIRSLTQARSLKGKRVLLRVDFNVPLRHKKIVSDYKIEKSLPTIQYLKKQGAKIIIVSHLGRPAGYDPMLSLKPIVHRLERILHERCLFIEIQKLKNCWEDAYHLTQELKNGDIAVLENIRFFKEEEKNSKSFIKKLASLADVFILDGFGVAHRAAASVSGVAKLLPTFAGKLLDEEVKSLSRVLEHPRRPLVLVLGGIKLETKIPVIKNFLLKADHILLGGGIVNTYLWALGKNVGNSVVDKEFKKIMMVLAKNKKIIIPHDFVIGSPAGANARAVVSANVSKEIQAGEGIYDIGPESLQLYEHYISKAGTLVWNGALGYFEQAPYQRGTFALTRIIAKQSKGRTFGVCGGGETEELLHKLHLIHDIDLVSTGGGAMLEFLGGKKLPGVEAVTSI